MACVDVTRGAEADMVDRAGEQASGPLPHASTVQTLPDLAWLLRQLRRRQARQHGGSPLTYRELAAKTGWSHGVIGGYLAGQVLPPTDRFDVLIKLLGATPAEQRELATARDRVEELRRAGAIASSPEAVIPRQLPPAVRYFVGRQAEMAQLTALLDGSARPGGTVVISAIGGTAGIGKTTLAVHWAHAVADRFGDGQMYVNMRGFDAADSPMAPAEAVRVLLDALGVAPERIPSTLDAQVGLYRSLMAERSVLVLLDNVRDADQVRPVLPGAPGCLVLVTSRNQLGSLVAADGAEPLTLDLLTAAEAQQLLAQRLGGQRVARAAGAVEEIIMRCARLPLALAIFAARAATHPHFDLADLAAELRQSGHRLDALDHGETASTIRSVFSWSYRQLSGPAAALYRLLGLHPGPTIAVAAAASLAGQPIEAVRDALAELTRSHMIAEPAPGRYAFHDLLRAYARELAYRLDAEAELHTAMARMLEHYLHSSCAADRLMNPNRDQIMLSPPHPGVRVEDFTDHTHALSWFDIEHAALVATVRHVADTGLDAQICQLVWALADYLDWQGHWRDLLDTQRAALSAAQRLSDRAEQARAERSLGSAYARMGSFGQACIHLENAVELYRSLGDPIGAAHAHLHLTSMWERQGRPADALRHAQQALGLARTAGHPKWCARALNAVGWYHGLLGEYEQVLDPCQQALALQNELGDRDGAADSWDSLGYAHYHLGHHQQSIDCYQNAVELWKVIGNRHGQAETLVSLGKSLVAMSRPGSARDAWLQALAILEQLDLPEAQNVRESLRHLDATADRQRR